MSVARSKKGKQKVSLDGGFRTAPEREEGGRIRACFDRNPARVEAKLDAFPKYVRRQPITRFLALYEIFKMVIPVKGSIIECGVHEGFGTMSWERFSAILEPVNFTRRIYGFDTFSGFPKISAKDKTHVSDAVEAGGLYANSYQELNELAAISASTRFIGHIPKVQLIKGDAVKTIPKFVQDTPHLLVSLLYLDFDLYAPTKAALKHFLPLMPAGAILAFDELDNPLWPGETQACIELMRSKRLRIERLPFDPYIGFARIE